MGSAALLERIDDLPRLPKAISELLDAVNDESATIKGIAEKVSQDQLVTARVLRMANSAYFGRSREVASLDEAVIRLGMQKLRTLVIASAVVGAMPEIEGFDIGEFWGHTFEVAVHCQAMAKNVDSVEPDAAFTCAILHSIGDMLIAVVAPDKVLEIKDEIARGMEKPQAEERVLGYDSAQLGALLAENWKFPLQLVDGIRFQYEPKRSRPYSSLAGLLHTSEALIAGWDEVCDTDKSCWMSQKAADAGLRLQMSELAGTLEEIRGQGYEMGKMLA
ncbi:HDOD domain-containing protein [Shewanella submarina]|uniref:HDOD domain-containing protein n=1 Tax=Shewanella submarina TaxID=2016376 RepID=A0ABV7GIM9_9GAMM|nr:HDOD domain-containing protein [Shewanella submarina]MCL1038934.1 HDOD domain-containing protein [Shewanella submarina]